MGAHEACWPTAGAALGFTLHTAVMSLSRFSPRNIGPVVTAGFILTLLAQSEPPLFGQESRAVEDHPSVIPFVGCESFGQIQKLEAPKGSGTSLSISSKDAPRLAYYKSADGIGVLAPRGWYCEGASGSSGSGLFVSPRPS